MSSLLSSRRRRLLAPTEPTPQHSQLDQRRRRRAHMSVHLTGSFDLADEVHSVCDELAQRVAAAPRPVVYRDAVDEVAEATHELLHVVIGLLAERAARPKVAHVKPGHRARAIRAFADLAPRPPQPQIDGLLVSGTWPAALARHVRPYAADLADYLGAAYPPDAQELRGHLSASERVVDALRGLDTAAISLARRLDRDESDRAARRDMSRPTKAEQARRELRQLGVEVDEVDNLQMETTT